MHNNNECCLVRYIIAMCAMGPFHLMHFNISPSSSSWSSSIQNCVLIHSHVLQFGSHWVSRSKNSNKHCSRSQCNSFHLDAVVVRCIASATKLQWTINHLCDRYFRSAFVIFFLIWYILFALGIPRTITITITLHTFAPTSIPFQAKWQ